MDPRHDRIVEFVIEQAGSTRPSFQDLLAECLEHTPLESLANELDLPPMELLLDLLIGEGRVWVGTRISLFEHLLDGTVFTRRLTAHEIEDDSLLTLTDLSVLDADVPFASSDGTELETDPDGGMVWLAEGALQGFSEGDLVAVRRTAGTVTFEAVESVASGEREADLLAEAYTWYTRERGEGAGVPLLPLVLYALEVEATAFRAPVPPVGDLLTMRDLQFDGELVGPVGMELESPFSEDFDEAIAALIGDYQLDECCVMELTNLMIAAMSSVDRDEAKRLARSLEHGMVAYAFGEWAAEWLTPEQGEAFFEVLTSHAGRSSWVRAGYGLWLLMRWEVIEAKRMIEAALTVDPDNPVACLELAYMALAENDFPRIISLLSRFGGDPHPLLSLALQFRPGTAATGRNEPCPCGSGRKYKSCHLGKVTVEPRDQVGILIRKVALFLDHPAAHHPLEEGADMVAESDDEYERLIDDTIFRQLVVFEGGGMAAYLEAMGPLLPEADRDTLELWLDIPLRLWEVEARQGTLVDVIDTKTAERITVDDRLIASGVEPGDLILTRFVPYADSWWSAGDGVNVDLRLRDSAIALLDSDPDFFAIGAWYSSLYAPPRITTRDAEDVVLVIARLAPSGSIGALVDALDRRFERHPDHPTFWIDFAELDDEQRLMRARLELIDGEVELRTVSQPRADRVIGALADVATVVARTDTPLETRADLIRGLAETAPPGSHDEPDDAIRAQVIEAMEDRWLSEQIPLLGDVTPREAAADPTRIDDLRRLIDSFPPPAPHPGMSMDPVSLRRKLGLD
ncbi:MAG: SEC-C metal-binding domain-containing protein [Acidimicrobiia bacterium]